MMRFLRNELQELLFKYLIVLNWMTRHMAASSDNIDVYFMDDTVTVCDSELYYRTSQQPLSRTLRFLYICSYRIMQQREDDEDAELLVSLSEHGH